MSVSGSSGSIMGAFDTSLSRIRAEGAQVTARARISKKTKYLNGELDMFSFRSSSNRFSFEYLVCFELEC